MNQDTHFKLIDKFLNGDLSPQEEEKVLFLIKTVPHLANYYNLSKDINDALQNKTLIAVGRELNKNKNKFK